METYSRNDLLTTKLCQTFNPHEGEWIMAQKFIFKVNLSFQAILPRLYLRWCSYIDWITSQFHHRVILCNIFAFNIQILISCWGFFVCFLGGFQWLYPSSENWIVSNGGCRMIFLEAHSVIASSSRSFNMINTSSSYSLWGKTLGRSTSSCLSQQMAPATQLTEAKKTRIDPQSQQRTLYCLYPGDFNNHSTPPFKYE